MPENPTKALKRFFVELPSVILESELPVQWTVDSTNSAELVHYLTQVVRIKPKEPLFLIDKVQGIGFEATVFGVSKKQMVLELLEKVMPPSLPSVSVTLTVALIKEYRWDWLLQKATELGVTEIVPLLTERVSLPGKMDWEKKQVRWHQVVQSASEQSERWILPKIHPVIQLNDWLESLPNSPNLIETEQRRLFGYEREECVLHKIVRLPLKQVLQQDMGNESLLLSKEWLAVIGPEGGWTPSEVSMLCDHHFQPVGLGSGILRAETAAIQMMGILNYELGL
jgi:16S rRNA (uracil1498-N3)-methyltransferase